MAKKNKTSKKTTKLALALLDIVKETAEGSYPTAVMEARWMLRAAVDESGVSLKLKAIKAETLKPRDEHY